MGQDLVLYILLASFPHNCPSSLLFQISTNLACPRSISLLVSFCYSYSQRVSFHLNCCLSLPVQISTDLAYHSSISILVSFCHSYSQRALFPLNCSSSSLFQISTNLAYPSSISLWSVCVTHIHKQHCFHSTVIYFLPFLISTNLAYPSSNKPFGQFLLPIFTKSIVSTQLSQGWTGMYILVVPSLYAKFITNGHQNLPVSPIFREKA